MRSIKSILQVVFFYSLVKECSIADAIPFSGMLSFIKCTYNSEGAKTYNCSLKSKNIPLSPLLNIPSRIKKK
jgi:hypothetical protein